MAAVYQPMQQQFNLATPLHAPTMPRGTKNVQQQVSNTQIYTSNLHDRFNAMQGPVRQVGDKQRRSTNLPIEQQAQLLTMSNGAFRNHLANFVDNFEHLLRISKKITKQSANLRSDDVLGKFVTDRNGVSRTYYLTTHSSEDFINDVITFINVSKKIFRFNKKLARRDTVVRREIRYRLFEQGRQLIGYLLSLIPEQAQLDEIKGYITQYLDSGVMTRTRMSSIIWMIIKMQEYVQNVGIINVAENGNWFITSAAGNLVRNPTIDIDTLLRANPMPNGSYDYGKTNAYGARKLSPISYHNNRIINEMMNYSMQLTVDSHVEQYASGKDKYDMKILIREGGNSDTIRQWIKNIHNLKIDFENDVLRRDRESGLEYQGRLQDLYQQSNAKNVGKTELTVASYQSRNMTSQKKITQLESNDDRITAQVGNIISILGSNIPKPADPRETDYSTLSDAEANTGKTIIDDMNNSRTAQFLDSKLRTLSKYRSAYVNMLNRQAKSNANVAQPNVMVTSSNI